MKRFSSFVTVRGLRRWLAGVRPPGTAGGAASVSLATDGSTTQTDSQPDYIFAGQVRKSGGGGFVVMPFVVAVDSADGLAFPPSTVRVIPKVQGSGASLARVGSLRPAGDQGVVFLETRYEVRVLNVEVSPEVFETSYEIEMQSCTVRVATMLPLSEPVVLNEDGETAGFVTGVTIGAMAVFSAGRICHTFSRPSAEVRYVST